MLDSTPSWLKTSLAAVILGLAANTIYDLTLRKLLEGRGQLVVDSGLLVFLGVFLLLLVLSALQAQWRIGTLGIQRVNKTARDSIEKGLKEATTSYWWLGTSAYYVLCNPDTREQYLNSKPSTDFLFVTVDPDCPAAVTAHSLWEHKPKDEIVDRINETKAKIEKLQQRRINISWEGRSTLPTFRVVIVNGRRVFVSFYEEGKAGPDCRQIELAANSMLGRWFVQFFEKSRLDFARMKIERTLARRLIQRLGISKEDLLKEAQSLCPNEKSDLIESVVSELGMDC
jgi:hypothetical protein